MMTQTHLLVACAAFSKPDNPARNTAAILGSLIPDFALYALFAWHRALGDSPDYIFRELYWSDSWQRLLAPGNSFIVYGALLLPAVALTNLPGWSAKVRNLVMVFSLAALLHVATDFPLHVEDAYAHFWPITDWKFVSPVSYWDHRYHGDIFQWLETALALVCIYFLFTRFQAVWVRILLVLALATYIIVPLMWALSLA